VEASLKRLGGFTAERTFEVTVPPVSVPD